MELSVNKISYRIITADVNEDISSLIDEIRNSKESKIYIYAPKTLKSLCNSLNMRLIKNESKALGKEIMIASQDQQIQKAANKADIPVVAAPPLAKSQNLSSGDESSRVSERFFPYRSKMFDIIPPDIAREEASYASSQVFSPGEEITDKDRYEEDSAEDELDSLHLHREEKVEEKHEEEPKEPPEEPKEKKRNHFPPIANILNVTKLKGVSITRNSAFFVFALAVFFGIGMFVFFVLPKAEIRIEPKKDLLSFDIAVHVNTNTQDIDFSKNVIPGELLESSIEESQDFLSSGKETREEKARGYITVYNEYSSSPQTLVENTRFISQDGKLFRTTETLVIPGATVKEGKIVPSSIEIEIMAQEAGEDYNIGPSTFSIPGFKGTPKYIAFYGKSSKQMQGGFIGEVEVVTEADLKNAEEKFKETLLGKVREDFDAKKPKEFMLLDNAVKEEVAELTFDRKAQEAAKSFTITGKAKVFGFVFDEEHISRLVDGTIRGRITEEREILEETKKLTYKDVELNVEKEEMNLLVGVEEWISARIDEQDIIENIRGKSLIEVKEYLSSHEAVDTARVTFSPFWIKRVPRAADKIKIEIIKTVVQEE